MFHETNIRFDLGFDPGICERFKPVTKTIKFRFEFEVEQQKDGRLVVGVKETKEVSHYQGRDHYSDGDWFWNVCPVRLSTELDAEMLQAYLDEKIDAQMAELTGPIPF